MARFHKEPTLAEAGDLCRQEEFRNWLIKEKNLSLSSVRKITMIGKSAFNWAYKRGELQKVPYFELDKPPKPEPKGRHLEIHEVAKLLRLAQHDHLKMFILLLIATAARPQAILDLKFEQIDLERNLIDLNPKVREEVRNKQRPVVKLPASLKSLLLTQRNHPNLNVINFKGEAVKSVKTSCGQLKRESG